MTAFVIDGDKGGVGKSFIARAVADHLITRKSGGKVVVIDCDASNQDVVCADGFGDSELVGGVEVQGVVSPVVDQEGWFKTIDTACAIATARGSDDIDFVFSLPAGAGLHIDDTVLSMLTLIAPIKTVWAMGRDKSSVDQLGARLDRAPLFYEHGLIALNEYHGTIARATFALWERSPIRAASVEAGLWSEFAVPHLNAFITQQIGSMPLHRAVEKSAAGELSPTLKIGIEMFRKVFGTKFRAALGV